MTIDLGPDPRQMKRLDLELEVIDLRAQVREYRRRDARVEESVRQDMALGVRCPRCGGLDPLARWDVCRDCAVDKGWEPVSRQPDRLSSPG